MTVTQAAIAMDRESVYSVAKGARAVLNIGLNLFLIPHFVGLGDSARACPAREVFVKMVLVFGLGITGLK